MEVGLGTGLGRITSLWFLKRGPYCIWKPADRSEVTQAMKDALDSGKFNGYVPSIGKFTLRLYSGSFQIFSALLTGINF